MRHRLLAFVLALLVCGCGGGGTTPAPAGPVADAPPVVDPPPELPPPAPPSLLELLQGCVTEDLQEGVLYVQSLLELAQTGQLQGLSVSGVDLVQRSLTWSLDPEDDADPEARGTIRFTDAAGHPTLPQGLLELLAGTATLTEVLANIPDGTHLLATFEVLRFVSGGGDLDIEFLTGMPWQASGSLAFENGDCATALSFTDATAPSVPGGYPSAAITLGAKVGTNTIDGTLVLDGTSVATLEVSLDGGPAETFVIDLALGTIAPPAAGSP